MITEKDLPTLGKTYSFGEIKVKAKHLMAYQLPNGNDKPIDRVLISEDEVNFFVFDINKWEMVNN